MRKLNTPPVCPLCKKEVNENLGAHLKRTHGEDEFKKAVLKAKESGISDPEIGALFNITFRQLQEIITEAYGIPVSVLKKPKRIKYWEPKNFKEETTTVWSFPQRGDWATHNGRFRGNWSPYIPRNVILKYSKPGEVVLDYFVGGGTTAVEAKLLGRRCVAKDINPWAIGLTRENLNFKMEKTTEGYLVYEPEVSVGDARDLSDVMQRYKTVDLICAHPPYAGIIDYSSKVEGDLSKLSIDEFLKEMRKVASESYKVLKPGGKCAILIGDTRKAKHEIPIGFKTINAFLDAGFNLKELVIKRQHKCKTTGFWYKKSIQYNFLLLAHEYLPIFEKPKQPAFPFDAKEVLSSNIDIGCTVVKLPMEEVDKLESTTVWIFPEKQLEKRLNKNVVDRYSNEGRYLALALAPHTKDEIPVSEENTKIDLLFIKSPFLNNVPSVAEIKQYLIKINEVVQRKAADIKKGGFLVIQTRDVRTNGFVEPLGKRIVDILKFDNLWLKEIVIVTQEEVPENKQVKNEDLEIVHQYLLVYEVTK
uniref:DNA methylase N-4/N-6 domain-containing protein n=1 Tax=candidate division CPR3 bacterium TaxID=2268181 RepID=A0A7V3N4Z3_UNCC3